MRETIYATTPILLSSSRLFYRPRWDGYIIFTYLWPTSRVPIIWQHRWTWERWLDSIMQYIRSRGDGQIMQVSKMWSGLQLIYTVTKMRNIKYLNIITKSVFIFYLKINIYMAKITRTHWMMLHFSVSAFYCCFIFWFLVLFCTSICCFFICGKIFFWSRIPGSSTAKVKNIPSGQQAKDSII